ncbi:hypothetical protein Trydic_g13756 [Trypoxylus dichotomus]
MTDIFVFNGNIDSPIYAICLPNSCTRKTFPSKWKSTRIIPILKPNKDHYFSNGYRSISLLTTISNVLETLLLTSINDHLDEHRLEDDDQFGFRPGHSITLQLYQITDHVKTSFNRKQTNIMASLDLEKAFDKIRHKGLVFKVKETGFPAKILKTI